VPALVVVPTGPLEISLSTFGLRYIFQERESWAPEPEGSLNTLLLAAIRSVYEGGMNGQREINDLLHFLANRTSSPLTTRLYVPFVFRKIDPSLRILVQEA
jgi:hypothetical protein